MKKRRGKVDSGRNIEEKDRETLSIEWRSEPRIRGEQGREEDDSHESMIEEIVGSRYEEG